MVDTVKLDPVSVKEMAYALSESFRRMGNNGGESSKSFFEGGQPSREYKGTDFDEKKLFNKIRTLDKHIAKEMASTKADEIKALQQNINQKEKMAKSSADNFEVFNLRALLIQKKKEQIDKRSQKFNVAKLKKQQEIFEKWKVEQKQSRENLKEGMVDTIDAFFTWKSAFAAAAASVTMAVGDFHTNLKYGTSDVQGAFGQMTAALRVGVDPEVLAELGAQNRASVIAMGGVEKWSDKLSDAQSNLYKYVGDNAEIARITSDSFETMRIAGIEPTFEALKTTTDGSKSLGNSFVQLQKMTGQTIAQSSAMMKSMLEVESVRTRLAGTLNQARRKEIMQEVVDRQKLLVKLGMMGDQAQKAAEALERMAGEDPTERFKKAASLQQMFSVLGMGGEGQRAAELERKGLSRTMQESADYAELLGKASHQVAKIRTEDAGGAGEFMIAALMKMPGMQERLSANSPFVAALLGSDQATRQADAEGIATMGESFVNATTVASAAALAANAAKSNPVVGAITAGLAAGGAIGKLLMAQLVLSRVGSAVQMAQLAAQGVMGMALAAGLSATVLGAAAWAATSDWTKDTAESTDNLDKKTPSPKDGKKRISIEQLEAMQKARIANDRKEAGIKVFGQMRKNLNASIAAGAGSDEYGGQMAAKGNFMREVIGTFQANVTSGKSVNIGDIQEKGLDTIAGILKEIKVANDAQVSFADLNHQGSKRMAQIMEDGVITAEEANIIANRDRVSKLPSN